MRIFRKFDVGPDFKDVIFVIVILDNICIPKQRICNSKVHLMFVKNV